MTTFDDRIVGTWRLVMTRAHDDAGTPMHPPCGPIPMGVTVFSADRRMIAVLCDPRPELPAGEAEREYNSYCWTYTFDGTTLSTRVDASSGSGAARQRSGPQGPLRRQTPRADAAAAALAWRDPASRALLGEG